MAIEQLQNQILTLLYEEHKRSFSQPPNEEDLVQQIGMPWNKFQYVIEYLEQKGYLIPKNKQIGSRLYRTFHLTSKGIDYVEGKKENDNSLSVEGDYINITVGNNARNLALGKEIIQKDAVATRTLAKELDAILQEFIQYLETDGKILISQDQFDEIEQQSSQLRHSLIKAGLI